MNIFLIFLNKFASINKIFYFLWTILNNPKKDEDSKNSIVNIGNIMCGQHPTTPSISA